jgi:hypothetical protein
MVYWGAALFTQIENVQRLSEVSPLVPFYAKNVGRISSLSQFLPYFMGCVGIIMIIFWKRTSGWFLAFYASCYTALIPIVFFIKSLFAIALIGGTMFLAGPVFFLFIKDRYQIKNRLIFIGASLGTINALVSCYSFELSMWLSGIQI